MKTLLKWIAVATTVAAMSLVVPATAQAAPYCGITWGSLPEEASPGSNALLTDIRVGRHACYDRLVLDMAGDVWGYSVRYVDQVVRDGSGELVPLRGGAKLEVTARSGAAPTDSFFLPNGELADVSAYRTFRHVAWAGSFEGQTTIGLGVRARLPFRVFILDGPGNGSRLIIDVAHRW
ncbi:MAG: AMIN-like domain-containing (lipo)protein [Geodermatophilaceae bacterium]